MKVYRDLKPGETLQAGDLRMSADPLEWVPVEAAWIGQLVPANLLAWLRRPVDLPVLQPVTPEAMAELEADEMVTVVCVSQDTAKTMTWLPARKEWQSSAGADNPLEWQWFVNLSTIPEVQQ